MFPPVYHRFLRLAAKALVDCDMKSWLVDCKPIWLVALLVSSKLLIDLSMS